MPTSTYVTREFTIEIEQRYEDVRTMRGGTYEIDPKWSYVDRAGHPHEADLWACEWVKTGEVSYDWDDVVELHELRCRLCGEVIEPGKVFVPDRPIPLPIRATLRARDGRVWRMRPDEVYYTSDEGVEGLAARVMQRAPDFRESVWIWTAK